ncbi:unannotated protein [freshwater metagenome]|uniref:Unannotated protein n=1 Tax=freshwater metagenome TaxID=449393 RepID=A0A6J7GTK8_9ZZZZ
MRPCEPVAAVANALTTSGSFRPSQVASCGNEVRASGVTNQPILPTAPSRPMLTTEPSSMNACSSGVKPEGHTSTFASISPDDMPGIIAFSSMSTISTGLQRLVSINCLTISTSMADAVQLLRAILIASVPVQAGPSATAVVSTLATSVAVSLPPHAANTSDPTANRPIPNNFLRDPMNLPLIKCTFQSERDFTLAKFCLLPVRSH